MESTLTAIHAHEGDPMKPSHLIPGFLVLSGAIFSIADYLDRLGHPEWSASRSVALLYLGLSVLVALFYYIVIRQWEHHTHHDSPL